MLTLKKRYTLAEAQTITLNYGYRIVPLYIDGRSGYDLKIVDGYQEPEKMIGGARTLASLIEWVVSNPAIKVEAEEIKSVSATLEVIESSVDNYDCVVNGQVIAEVKYDWANDGATQPWIVTINGQVVHAANTQSKCTGWVSRHFKDGTLPTIELETVEEECDSLGVIAYASDVATDTWVVLMPTNIMIGVAGRNSDGWWSLPSSSQSGIPICGKSRKVVLEKMILVEEVLRKPEMFVYQIVIDGTEENILRETREFTSDADAIN